MDEHMLSRCGLLHSPCDKITANDIFEGLRQRGFEVALMTAHPGTLILEDTPNSICIVVTAAALHDDSWLDLLDDVRDRVLYFLVVDRAAIPIGPRGRLFDFRWSGLSHVEISTRMDSLALALKGVESSVRTTFSFHSDELLSESARRSVVREQAKRPVSILAAVLCSAACPFAAYVSYRINDASESLTFSMWLVSTNFMLLLPVGIVIATEGAWTYGSRVSIFRPFEVRRYIREAATRVSVLLFLSALTAGSVGFGFIAIRSIQRSADSIGILSACFLFGLILFFLYAIAVAMLLWCCRLPKYVINRVYRSKVFAIDLGVHR
jgi:hypothetical protein